MDVRFTVGILAALYTSGLLLADNQAHARASEKPPLSAAYTCASLPSRVANESLQDLKIAIVVGIGAYPNSSGFAPLHFAVSDAHEIAAELRKLGYTVVLLTDGQATKDVILDQICRATSSRAVVPDSVMFFFSGHGFQAGDTNYLATYNSQISNLAGTGTAIESIRQGLIATRAPHQMMFIDACRNAPSFGKKGTEALSFGALQRSRGLKALLSTAPGGVSWEEGGNIEHGIFTFFLLEGLKGKAARRGLISFNPLAEYVTANVRRFSEEKEHEQIPYEVIDSTGDFLIGEIPQNDSESNVVRVFTQVEAGQNQLNLIDGLHYSLIPPGTFDMGCISSVSDCSDLETPIHTVKISKGFWLGQTEVTLGAFRRFAGATNTPLPTPPFPQNDAHPIVGVTWTEASAYCEWIGGRLPYEAEWEYAASTMDAEFARVPLTDLAWFADNSGKTPLVSGQLWPEDKLGFAETVRANKCQTHPVAQKLSGPHGLYDMLGNVWEWCQDWFGYYSSDSMTDPHGFGQGSDKILRGGAWDSSPQDLHRFRRYKLNPGIRDERNGFRCVWNRQSP